MHLQNQPLYSKDNFMKEHSEKVFVAIQYLNISRNNTFDNIINLAMSGEMNHLADAIDVGDKYTFTLNHFYIISTKIKA